MIGILCGLKSEAKIADKITGVIVGCSAARPEQALGLARYMVDRGARRLVSFGLAGAASPDLRGGDLVLGATVMAAGGASWEADAAWNDRLLQRLDCFTCAPVWGSKHLVKSVEEKTAIYRRAGCLLTDMESHIVAEVAQEEGIPFNVVRAISDTAAMPLPPAAQIPLFEDGGVDLRSVFSSLINQPSQLTALLSLAQNTSRALRALKRAATAMGEIDDDAAAD